MRNKLLVISLGLAGAACAYLLNNYSANRNFRVDRNEVLLHQDGEEHEENIMDVLGYMNSLRINQTTGKVDAQDVYNAVAQADVLQGKYKTNATSLQWQEMGPDNVGGRTRCLIIDKDNPKVLYAASVGGGLWVSYTAGSNWKKISPGNDNFPVVSITQTEDGAVYMGTGELPFVFAEGTNTGSGFIGNGLWKGVRAADSSWTWTRVNGTNPNSNTKWQNVTSLATSPDRKRIYAATSGGLFFLDQGSTAAPTNLNISSSVVFEVKVASNGTVMAATQSRVYISPSGAAGTFTSVQLTSNSTNRISIAVSDADPNYMYAMTSGSNSQLEGVYRSTTGGGVGSWSRIGANSTELNILASQGTYDNVIAVDPDDKNHIFAGGLGNWEWRAGGGWRQISSLGEFLVDKTYNRYYVHADMHGYAFDKSTTPYTMYLVNDGGVFRSRNKGVTFEKLNFNYSVTQLYSVAVNKRGEILCGSQDNGTNLIDFTRNVKLGQSSKSAIEALGGDGFFCEFSRINPDICYAANIGNFYRSLNKGQSWSEFFDGNIGANGENLGVSFLTPYKLWESVLDQNLPDTTQQGMMFYGGATGAVWMTPDVIDFAKTPHFYKLAQVATSGQILSMDFTPSGNTLFVGTYSGRLYRISGIRGTNYNPDSATGWNAAAHGIVVEAINVPIGSQAITSISVHPGDTNIVVFTCGNYGNANYVFKSTNAMGIAPLVSFSSIQGSLPQMPIYSSVINIDNPNHIIVGSELGIWASTNGGTTWTEENTGLSRTPCYMIRQYEWKPWEGPSLYVATHGRGVFASKTLLTGINKPSGNLSKAVATVYPNPATDAVSVEFTLNKAAAVTVQILNLNGQTVLTKRIADGKKGMNKANINLDAVARGTYILRVEGSGEVSTGKLIVVK